jgi:integrase
MGYAERPHVLADGTRIPALRMPNSNPARGVALNSEEKRQRFLSPAELARLAEVLREHPARNSANLVRFLVLTGARFGEAATATWDQIDFRRGTWVKPSSHTKQKREHQAPLAASALALLAELPRTGPYLFPGKDGRPIGSVKTFWRTVCRRAGLAGVRIHDLRHSFAAVLASGGASLPLIGSLLGHTQAVTTSRYAHLIDSVQREAVERAGAVLDGRATAEVIPIKAAR